MSSASPGGARDLPDLTGEQARELLDAVVGVASDLRLPDVLRRIVDSAARLVGARFAALGVLGEGGRELAEFLVTGLSPEDERRVGPHPTGKGVLGLLIAQPEPLRLADIRRHPMSYGFPPNHPPMRSFLGVPVRVAGAVFGNLYLAEKLDPEHPDAAEFTLRDEQVVVALAAAAGVAIEKARLYDDLARRERWLEAANAVIPALLAERGPAAVLERVARQARTASDAPFAAVALPDDRNGVWRVHAASGPNAAGITGTRVDTDHPAVHDALKRPEPLSFDDPGLLPALLGPDRGDARAVLVVPIALGSDPLGVLLVAGPRPFLEVDRAAAGVFAGHAALALEVARAQDDQRRLALYEERDRIARDLHDSVIQQLFGTGLRAQGLREIVTQPGIADRIDGFVTDLDRTIRDIRRTIFDLQEVPEPEPVSLRAQILRVVHDATRALHLEPVVTVTGPLEIHIPDEVRVDVLATLREALSNAVRHAGAGQVHVELTVVEPGDDERGRLDLRVRDDGRGIPRGARGGGGLANMGDRAARWGGRFVVEPGADGGTQVHWSVPLPRDPDEDEP